MLELHWEILREPQQRALESLREFAGYGVLGGGTALALQFGHRVSVDLDFFLSKPLSLQFTAKIQKFYGDIETLVRTGDEFSFVTSDQVKLTFLFYPYRPLYATIDTPFVKLYAWKDIALDKAHTIGRRQEWRDYVDLYYSLKQGFKLGRLLLQAEEKFGDSFSSKLFLSQLVYLEDLTEFESVEFIKDSATPEQVRAFFIKEIEKLGLAQ